MIEREEILAKKIKVDTELSILKGKIDDAKRTAAAKGKFLPIDQLREMEDRRGMLARLSQKMQNEISVLNKKRKEGAQQHHGKSRPALFMEAAERILDDEMFDRILEEAGL